MISVEEAKEAARTLRQFCNEQASCEKCNFGVSQKLVILQKYFTVVHVILQTKIGSKTRKAVLKMSEGEKMSEGGYCYLVNNKKGKCVDFWIMDKSTPKEASVIFSCRFSRYVKPKSKPIEMLIYDAIYENLKSQQEGKMKRVIEISDTLYKTCKKLVDEGDPRPSECCIANSEPYEPQETSEWVLDSDGLPVCQKCGEVALQRIFVKMPHLIQDVRMVRSNYCPNCGSRMKAGAE